MERFNRETKESILKHIKREEYLKLDKNTPLNEIYGAVYDLTLRGMVGYYFLLFTPGTEPKMDATRADFYRYLEDYDKDGLLVNIWLFHNFLQGGYTWEEYFDLSYKLNWTKKEAQKINKNEILKECNVII